MSNLKYGKKKSRYMTVMVSMFAMPVIAILTFLGIVPLDFWLGWMAVLVFIVAVIVYFTKYRNNKYARFGMKKGDEDNIG